MILVILAFDLVFLLVWVLKDPLTRDIVKLPHESDVNNDEIIYDPIIEICKCNHETIWISKIECKNLKAIEN